MRDFFYEELNNDDSIIEGNIDTEESLDCLYGSLNKLVVPQEYTGETTESIIVEVDNVNRLIKADVRYSKVASVEALDNAVKSLTHYVDINVQELNDRIDNLDTQFGKELRQEIEDRKSEDSRIDAKLNEEIETRINDVSRLNKRLDDEIADREKDETVLSDRINTTNDKLDEEIKTRADEDTNIRNALQIESTTREQADSDLTDKLNEEIETRTTEHKQINSDIAKETQAREEKDTDLQNQLNTEKSTRETNDNTLQSNIDRVEEESKERDETLQTNITTEETERKSEITRLDNAIKAEETARKNSDETINQSISDLDTKLTNAINTEKTDRETEDNKLQNQIDNLSITKLNRTNADRNLLTSAEFVFTENNATVKHTYINLDTQAGDTKEVDFPAANPTTAGLMSKEDYNTLYNLRTRVGNLESKTTRYLYTDKTNPSANEIDTFVGSKGGIAPYTGIAVVVDKTFHIWHYYVNDNIGWRDDGLDTVEAFTNEDAGIIKGEQTDGKVYAETDGTGSVFGWSALKTRVSNTESSITKLQGDLSAETTNRTTADNNLQSQITNNASDIADEITNRTNADTTLQTNIDNEASARTQADTTLQSNINTLSTNVTEGLGAINDELDTFGNIVTHNINEFATASQGTKADSALQPNDNISQLTNDKGFTKTESSTTNGNIKINGNEINVYTLPADVPHDANYIHTDNNYTTAEKNKLNGIESGSQVNIIEDVKFNGTSLPITNKSVNVIAQATLESGTNIRTVNGQSLLDVSKGDLKIVSGEWGKITGTLADQTDLKEALDNKVTLNTQQTISGIKTFSSSPILNTGATLKGTLQASGTPDIGTNLNKFGTVYATTFNGTATNATNAPLVTDDDNSTKIANTQWVNRNTTALTIWTYAD